MRAAGGRLAGGRAEADAVDCVFDGESPKRTHRHNGARRAAIVALVNDGDAAVGVVGICTGVCAWLRVCVGGVVVGGG